MKVCSYSVLVLMQTKSRSENGNWYGKSIAIFKRVLLRKHVLRCINFQSVFNIESRSLLESQWGY